MAANKVHIGVIRRYSFDSRLKKAGLLRDLEIETSPLTPHFSKVIQSYGVP